MLIVLTLIITVTVTITVAACIVLRTTKRKHTFELSTGILHVVYVTSIFVILIVVGCCMYIKKKQSLTSVEGIYSCVILM